jgi:hypothetical protein
MPLAPVVGAALARILRCREDRLAHADPHDQRIVGVRCVEGGSPRVV